MVSTQHARGSIPQCPLRRAVTLGQTLGQRIPRLSQSVCAKRSPLSLKTLLTLTRQTGLLHVLITDAQAPHGRNVVLNVRSERSDAFMRTLQLLTEQI